MPWHSGTITRIETLSPKVKSFSLRLPAPMPFRPGQHVVLRLSAPDGYHAQRSYSISSAPGGAAGEVEITLGKVEGGEVSTFMHDHVQLGDRVELRGPIGGHFIWTPADGGPVLFLAGGTGVTPFMSMLRHRAAVGSQVPGTLVFSAKHREDLLFFDELSTLAGRRDGFTLKVTLTRETSLHPFRAGRIDARLIAETIATMPDPVRWVLVCGSDPFVEAAAEAAVSAGIDAALIRTERFGS